MKGSTNQESEGRRKECKMKEEKRMRGEERYYREPPGFAERERRSLVSAHPRQMKEHWRTYWLKQSGEVKV